MARPRKSQGPALPPHFAVWAESVGEAIGRGLARVLNASLSLPQGAAAPVARRGPGRPRKSLSVSFGAASGARKCSVAGCPNAVRSKGMCSAHYQAARRRAMKA
ncbi:MAG: hypothetical protein L0Y66_18960 [Myxococcaceae bacterium]|nr:hypothetical protein [Myxococcaceae bacterium]MCI0672529.1 hypothetical protein [Myxococcaceae bacterium]